MNTKLKYIAINAAISSGAVVVGSILAQVGYGWVGFAVCGLGFVWLTIGTVVIRGEVY